jgi:hypothetical protein
VRFSTLVLWLALVALASGLPFTAYPSVGAKILRDLKISFPGRHLLYTGILRDSFFPLAHFIPVRGSGGFLGHDRERVQLGMNANAIDQLDGGALRYLAGT